MFFKKPPLIFNNENPFENDALDRRESAEILTNFTQTIKEPFVLSINSPWGTGKTTFLLMWKQYLENEGIKCLYFNAWENDYSEDPFIALMGEIQSEIVSTLGEDQSKAKEYFQKAKSVSGTIAKRSLPVLIKIATHGILDLEDGFESEIANLASELTEERIDNYESNKATLKQFKENLEGFAQEISKNSDGPVVFFIDELDRCRPTFAIELLERLKHIFNITGIFFILALDKDELANSIQARYGLLNTDGYLRRFIDLEYQLPSISNEQYWKHLYQVFKFDDFFNERTNGRDESEWILEIFCDLSNVYNFSLRQQDQAFTQFSIVLHTIPKNYKIFPDLLAFLIALKFGNKSLYYDFINERISADEIMKQIESQPRCQNFFTENRERLQLKANVFSAFCSYEEIMKLSEYYQQKAAGDLADTTPQNAIEIKFMSKALEQMAFDSRTYKKGKYLAKKIEIAENFISETKDIQ